MRAMTEMQARRSVRGWRRQGSDGWLVLAALALVAWDFYWLAECFR